MTDAERGTSGRPDLFRFVQLAPFPVQWDRLGLDGEALRALELAILTDPKRGDVIPGGAGLRKLRFTPPGAKRGKSGAFRVFYTDYEAHGTIVLWAIIAKSEAADLKRSDMTAIAARVNGIRRLLDEGKIR